MTEDNRIEIVVYPPLNPKPEPRLKRTIVEGRDDYE